MATPALVVLVVGLAAGTLVVVGVVLVVVQRAVRAYRDASRTLERVQPLLEQLADHQAVTRRELDRVSQRIEGAESDGSTGGEAGGHKDPGSGEDKGLTSGQEPDATPGWAGGSVH